MAPTVVIVRMGVIRFRRNSGLPSNISTVYLKKLHPDCRLGAFFMSSLFNLQL